MVASTKTICSLAKLSNMLNSFWGRFVGVQHCISIRPDIATEEESCQETQVSSALHFAPRPPLRSTLAMPATGSRKAAAKPTESAILCDTCQCSIRVSKVYALMKIFRFIIQNRISHSTPNAALAWKRRPPLPRCTAMGRVKISVPALIDTRLTSI